jgi:hypothetical protein
MKTVAILLVVGLGCVVWGCGNNVPRTVTNTTTSGNWEAQLIDPTGGPGTQLNFVVSFNVTNNGPLDITGFAFFNQGPCFTTGLTTSTQSGNASFTTNTATGQVTGNLNLTITSTTNSSVLTLTSNPNGLTGTSSGTLTTTGVLSNGVVVGTWKLANSTDPSCNSPASGSSQTQTTGFTFIMCQNASTCSPTATDRPDPVAETLLSKPKIR